MAPIKQRLKRLPPEFYRSHAWVHWTITIQDRRTGWLSSNFLYKFRELLTHAMFRHQTACPIYCLMPEHIHLLWAGLSERSDQLKAMKSFRRDLNETLRRIDFLLQHQSYDHVLRDQELEQHAIETVAEYIARNPERRQLIPSDTFASYPYTGCLLPGAAQLRLFTANGWDEVWRTLSFLKRTECFRKPDPKYTPGP